MKKYRCKRSLSPSRRSSPFAHVRGWLASAVKIRHSQAYTVRRRRPLSSRLVHGCHCLLERLNTRWIRAAGKMAMAVAATMVVYMVVGNYLHQSFTGEIKQLSAEKQQREKDHVVIQAELTNIVKQNQDRLGLVEGKPEQLIRMN